MTDKQLIEKNKQRLEEEKARLEKLTARDGKFENTGDDEDSNANEVEQYGESLAEGRDMNVRLELVKAALEKISNGTYGVCAVGGEEIPADRLEAFPEAATCTAHA